MADTLTQDRRKITISTPLGQDVLLLRRFRGREELSRLFSFDLDLVSQTLDIDATRIVGKAVTVSVSLADGSSRYFNGCVSDFSAGTLQYSGEIRCYRATVVPWLWFLTLASNCRIFQQQSVPDIIGQIFSDVGWSDFEKQLSQTYPALDYCVQYRETDFEFVSRLMEAAGIFYFFKHENEKHTLVLADDASKYVQCTENSVSCFGNSDQQVAGRITGWDHSYRFTPGKYTQTDYNFTTPATDLTASEATVVPLSGISSYELFDYPGQYLTASDGTSLAKIRMQEREWPYETIRGASSCGSFTTGGKFEVADHPIEAEKNKSFVLISIEHDVAEPVQYLSQAGRSEQIPYSNRFDCIPASVVFRPARQTPRPQIRGPQSAVVVGSSGQELLTDEYGRIKVQFFWDRLGKKDENSSCWIRVAQNLAGNTWGTQFLPRVGQEVLVEFLDGDPDRPIIIGSVYNANQMPPYALPDQQNKSGLRTRSTTGGDDTTFSELTFDDTKGKEQIYFHAERDFLREVENNDTLKVGYDLKNPGDQTIQIYNNRTVTIEQGTDSLEVQTGDRKVTIDKGQDTLTISEGDRTVTLSKGNLTLTLNKGNESVTLSAGNRTITLDQGNDTLNVKAGNHEIDVASGSSTISAMQSITLKCGGNSITIDQQGITVSGTMVKIQGQTQVNVQGSMVGISGDGMVQIKGGMITLN